jgi:methylenetetrahydrofolate reductase (NADPH)
MSDKRTFSFEFFPPKTPEGMEKLRATRSQLAQLNPKFFSVTFGAGGSTRERTLETVLEIQAAGSAAAPHLSCIGSTQESIQETLDTYKAQGIRHIVALRGDLPSGMADPGAFRYANELVAFIRQQTGDWFQIEVAAYPEIHPQAKNAQDAYFRFVDDCQAMNVTLPIVPGIMPITNCAQLLRFSDACGAEIPRWIRKRLEAYGEDLDSIRAFGLDVVTDLCDRLLQGGAPGLHFYTLNQAGPSSTIWQRLGL